jgi:ADP-heptose:LPS heptosyltransferase
VNVLAIRLQATGDVAIPLPYLSSLKSRRPEARIDFLTREESAAIPRSVLFFSHVFAVGGGRSFKKQCLSALLLLPRLLARRYDVVVDLQNNELSRWITSALRPDVRSAFDRVSPLPAGERTRRALDDAGLGPVGLEAAIPIRGEEEAERLLEKAGLRPHERLVVLNPAGAFPSRNWPLDRYAAFARKLQGMDSRPVKFLVLGLPSLRNQAEHLGRELGESLLDLVGRTTLSEAFALVRRADLVLSEDSGLMHMAWVSGVPTIALFGSSRGDWSRPLGERSICLDSSDLECRFCMEAECRYGDVRCLTRWTPEEIASLSFGLMNGAR